jgi:hypothetical protein
MTHEPDKYAEFADHPRYGSWPNVTGLNPQPTDRGVDLGSNASSNEELRERLEPLFEDKWVYDYLSANIRHSKRIPNTAIKADLSQQPRAVIPVTHYFDLERQCRDCDQKFIFFAEEQKHWYEQLGFGLDSDCVRCVPCRKQQQGTAAQREIYESLFHVPDKTETQLLEMAEACLSLVEQNVFTTRQTERVRMLLNLIPEDADVRLESGFVDLVKRVVAVENLEQEKKDDPS